MGLKATAWMAALGILTACGGGTDRDDGAAASTAQPSAVTATTCPVASQGSGVSPEVPFSHDFNVAFDTAGVAADWVVDKTGVTAGTWSAGMETDPAHTDGSGCSQRLTLNADGTGAIPHLVRFMRLAQNTTYRVEAWVQADQPTFVQFQMRRESSTEGRVVAASETVLANTVPLKVVFEGQYPYAELASLRLAAQERGRKVWLDSVKVTPVASDPNALRLPTEGFAPGRTELRKWTFDTTGSDWRAPWDVISLYEGSKPNPIRSTEVLYGRTTPGSMKYTDSSPGGDGWTDPQALLSYLFTEAQPGRVYLGSFIAATTAEKVRLELTFEGESPDDNTKYFARKLVEITRGGWRGVNIVGAFPGKGKNFSWKIRVLDKNVPVWFDDVKLEKLTQNLLKPQAQIPLPSTFFGLHVQKSTEGSKWWPATKPDVLRLWDANMSWGHLQPEGASSVVLGSWSDLRVQRPQDEARNAGTNTEVLLTLGQPPKAFSTTPHLKGRYGWDGGSGAATSPYDPWKAYIRSIAHRYNNSVYKLRYWELWNEPDIPTRKDVNNQVIPGFYDGTIDEMVKMGEAARDVLHGELQGQGHTLLSPGMSNGNGFLWLSRFLQRGGGAVVDGIAYHFYYRPNRYGDWEYPHPEGLVHQLANLRWLMGNHNVSLLPLWVTEGGTQCCDDIDPRSAELTSVTPRALMVMWSQGVSNFDYYTWEGAYLKDFSRLFNHQTGRMTTLGKAYYEVQRWMKGATLLDAYTVADTRVAGTPVDSADVYVFKLQRGTDIQHVLWSVVEGRRVQLPWNVRWVRSLSGDNVMLGADKQLTVGQEPVLVSEREFR